ncbi:C4-dicarboxylate ABC transporter substrate-binding protein [Loktanella sp. 22II-4b]|nr:C4-dicarboxylate ABC transporter substrate-binding protein [Loktanella sp. 22II-4b]
MTSFSFANAVQSAPETVGIATSNAGSLHYNMATAIARAANDAGLKTTVQPATSANQYLPHINAGGIEFGISNLQEMNYALTGAEWWNGLASPNLRVVALLMPLREAIFVRADSDIRSVADLRGRKVPAGYVAQNSINAQLAAFYAAAGLDEGDIRPVNVPSVVAGADAFISGDAEAFIFALGAGKVSEAAAAVGGLRALGVAKPDEETLKAARGAWPTLTFVEVAAGSAIGVDDDGVFFALPQALVTHAGVPDETVAAMARVLHEGHEVLTSTFPGFALFNPMAMKGDVGTAEYHPGALQFYQEIGLE